MKKENEPLVSLIAVCHNHNSFIFDCIRSLVNQSYRNSEIIVYDNGSTDGSVEVLQQLQKQFGFNLICQENIGQSKTCNKAIKLAKGKYIGFISTDDYWPLDKIEIAVNFMENCDEQIAVCGGNAITVNNNGMIFNKQTFVGYHELAFHDVFVYGKIIPAVTSLIRKSAVIKVGGFDEDLVGEDTPMWLKLTYNGYKIAFLNQLLGYYRHHEANITHQRDGIFEIVEKIYGKYSHHPDYERALSGKYFRTFSRYSKIDKLYSLKFIKHIKIKYLSIKDVVFAILFFLMPYKLISRITKII